MQIILSPLCASLTGTLDKTHGYAIRRYKHGFFSVRTPRPDIPADGHWRFILACAELAQMGLHLSGIKVCAQEVHDALYEAGHFIAARRVLKYLQPTALMSAKDILNLKTEFAL